MSFCLCHPRIATNVSSYGVGRDQRSILTVKGMKSTRLFEQRFMGTEAMLSVHFSVPVRSRAKIRPTVVHGNSFSVFASWLATPELATVFTFGTAAVLPFYTLMVVAPEAELTKKTMRSMLPYISLGLLYAYLVYISWTPDTLHLTFGGTNGMHEFSGIVKLFSNETTLVSVWIHLLTVDLFAARQVYLDGLEKNVDTRHSVCLCMFCCPVGIGIHAITKATNREVAKESLTPAL